MVVASTSAEILERSLGDIGKSFAIVNRSGRPRGRRRSWPWTRIRCRWPRLPRRVPACQLEDLGDASFRADHGLRYALMSGAMANGIGSVEIVEAMGRSGIPGDLRRGGVAPGRGRAGD